jgi:hypothetical protein
MFGLSPATKVYLAAGATDLRKGFEGLQGLVRDRFALDPFSGHLVIFCNARRNRLKVLFWDGSGLWVCANTHTPHCSHWKFFKTSLPLPSPLRKRARSIWRRGRQTGPRIRPTPEPHDARDSGVDV